MTVFLVVFLIALGLNLHLLRYPLTEDEGNFYYFPQFRNRGVQMHTHCGATGYYNLGWQANLWSRLRGQHSPRIWQEYKIILHSFGAVSVAWLAWVLCASSLTALLAGLLFAVVTHARATKFWATYGEHGQVAFNSVALGAAFLAQQGHGLPWAVLAGFAMSMSIHYKPTALLLALGLFTFLPFSPHGAENTLAYATSLLTLLLLPWFSLRSRPALWKDFPLYKNGWLQYWHLTIRAQIQNGITQLYNFLGKPQNQTYESYTSAIFKRSKGKRWDQFLTAMLDSVRSLWLIIFCALMQVAWGGIHAPYIVFLLALYLAAMLLTQHIQQNYYMPHFNIIWPPICILGAMFIHSVLQEGVSSPGAWLMTGLGLLFLGQRAHEAWKLRNNHVPWVRYLEAACIGKALHPVVQRNDVLLAMGLFPSINIYADCPGIPTHLFPCMGGKITHEAILTRRLREDPPQWITFFTPTEPCPWDISHIMEVSGQVYTMRTLDIEKQCVEELARHDSGLRQCIVFRRDDNICAINQCTLGKDALERGDIPAARRLFTNASSTLPREMALRLEMLDMTPDTALEHLQQCRAALPAEATFVLAEIFQERGTQPLARKYLTELSTQKDNPYTTDARFHTLRALSREGETHAEAKQLQMLIHALQLHPFHVPALRAIIALLMKAGQAADAAPLAQRLATLCDEAAPPPVTNDTSVDATNPALDKA